MSGLHLCDFCRDFGSCQKGLHWSRSPPFYPIELRAQRGTPPFLHSGFGTELKTFVEAAYPPATGGLDHDGTHLSPWSVRMTYGLSSHHKIVEIVGSVQHVIIWENMCMSTKCIIVRVNGVNREPPRSVIASESAAGAAPWQPRYYLVSWTMNCASCIDVCCVSHYGVRSLCCAKITT